VVQLGPLVRVAGVFQSQFVQAEFLLDHGEVLGTGPTQVEPDHRGRIFQMIRYVLDGKVLELQDAVLVQPAERHAGERNRP
jgi:hypothetical protein